MEQGRWSSEQNWLRSPPPLPKPWLRILRCPKSKSQWSPPGTNHIPRPGFSPGGNCKPIFPPSLLSEEYTQAQQSPRSGKLLGEPRHRAVGVAGVELAGFSTKLNSLPSPHARSQLRDYILQEASLIPSQAGLRPSGGDPQPHFISRWQYLPWSWTAGFPDLIPPCTSFLGPQSVRKLLSHSSGG